MAKQDDDNDIFDVLSFIKRLESRAAAKFRRRDCIKPDQCSHDVVSDLLPKHSKYTENKVELDHPLARNQQPFLFSSLKFAIQNKHKTCKDCKTGIIPIVEDSDLPPDPVTPETLYSERELIERVLSRIKNARHREVFRARVLDEDSYDEIAAELGVPERRARKWVERDKKFLRKEFPSIRSLWQDDAPGFSGQPT